MQFLHGKYQATATGKCSNAETNSPWQLGRRGWMGRSVVADRQGSEEKPSKVRKKGGANINKRMEVAARNPSNGHSPG